jgi:choice-of-anchor B domain-containing protein
MKKKLLVFLFLTGFFYSCNETIVESVFTGIPLEEEIEVLPNTPCDDGMAGPFPCDNYDLVNLIEREDFMGPLPSQEIWTVWGWTDPVTQKEYAIAGTTNGVHFIDVTDPVHPIHIGRVPSFSASVHHYQTVRVYRDHAFIVASNSDDYGMRVFDLTRLRDAGGQDPELFVQYTEYGVGVFGHASSIAIDEDSGYAYVVGTSTFEGGPHFVNISLPASPIPAGGYDNEGLTRTAQAVTYTGPDTDYLGREIFVGSNQDKVTIIDVTDKNNPVTISSIEYGNFGYPVQGQFTDDMRYFILGDFWDEPAGSNTRTIVLDLQDLDDPKEHLNYFNPIMVADYGAYINGDVLYQANLAAGVRMIDISKVDGFTLRQIGFFDTHPEHDAPVSLDGVLSVYPHFTSGNILLADFDGIFIIKRSR